MLSRMLFGLVFNEMMYISDDYIKMFGKKKLSKIARIHARTKRSIKVNSIQDFALAYIFLFILIFD